MATSRRTSTAEFEAEAVRRVTERGKGLAEVARELDPGERLLRGWARAWPPRRTGPPRARGIFPPVEEQPRRLRADDQRLHAEREILKRATAFLAGEWS
jgi:transposase